MGVETKILHNISLQLEKSKSLSIVGPSGSGKTTLLQLIGMLDRPTSGKIEILGKDITKLTESEKINIMQKDISFIHQFHHLFPEFSAIENVIIPQLNIGITKNVAIENAKSILQELDLGNRLDFHPWQLSGGERQRVAMARAIVNNPKLILADEPTGSLDPENGNKVIEMLLEICKRKGASLVIVTHNSDIAKKTDDIYSIGKSTI